MAGKPPDVSEKQAGSKDAVPKVNAAPQSLSEQGRQQRLGGRYVYRDTQEHPYEEKFIAACLLSITLVSCMNDFSLDGHQIMINPHWDRFRGRRPLIRPACDEI